jgi:hypothetical protein
MCAQPRLTWAVLGLSLNLFEGLAAAREEAEQPPTLPANPTRMVNELFDVTGPFIWPTDCKVVIPNFRDHIKAALAPLIREDARAFTAAVTSDAFFHRCQWDRKDWPERNCGINNLNDDCSYVFELALDTDAKEVASLLHARLDRPAAHPTAWGKLPLSRLPPDVVVRVYDASLAECREVWTNAKFCFDLLCDQVAPRDWALAEPRVAQLGEHPLQTGYDVEVDDISFIEKCIRTEFKLGKGPQVTRYLVNRAKQSADPVTSRAFALYQDSLYDIPEANELVIAAARRWLVTPFASGEWSEEISYGRRLAGQLEAMPTPEAKTVLAALTPVLAQRKSAKTANGRRAAFDRLPEQAARAWPLFAMSLLGIGQLLAWRKGRIPGGARNALIVLNTALAGGLAACALAGAVAWVGVGPTGTPPGLGSYGNAMSGLGGMLATIGVALLGGLGGLCVAGYVGYRLRDRRRFYVAIAIATAVLPMLLALYYLAMPIIAPE